MTLTEKDLDEIEARAKGAQTGPWVARTAKDLEGWPCLFTAGEDSEGRTWVVETDGVAASRTNGATAEDDARFAAAARTDVPRLVAEVRRLLAFEAFVSALADEDCECASERLRGLDECLACEAGSLWTGSHEGPT